MCKFKLDPNEYYQNSIRRSHSPCGDMHGVSNLLFQRLELLPLFVFVSIYPPQGLPVGLSALCIYLQDLIYTLILLIFRIYIFFISSTFLYFDSLQFVQAKHLCEHPHIALRLVCILLGTGVLTCSCTSNNGLLALYSNTVSVIY